MMDQIGWAVAELPRTLSWSLALVILALLLARAASDKPILALVLAGTAQTSQSSVLVAGVALDELFFLATCSPSTVPIVKQLTVGGGRGGPRILRLGIQNAKGSFKFVFLHYKA